MNGICGIIVFYLYYPFVRSRELLQERKERKKSQKKIKQFRKKYPEEYARFQAAKED